MHFDKQQKEIIKAINSGEVFDILSFVKKFGCFEVYKNSKEELLDAFNKREENIEYPVYVYEENDLLYRGERKLEHVKAQLKYDEKFSIYHDGQNYIYDAFDDKGILIKTSFGDIKNFIAIWEYLKRELQILEVDKEIDTEEIGLFFEKVPNEVYSPDENKKMIDSPYGPPIVNYDSNGVPKYKKIISAREFIEYRLSVNIEELLVCSDYLEKKIIPTPALDNFVKDKFSTPEQKATKWSLIAAWIAIIISIFTTGFSIYATYNVDPSDMNLKLIQKQLEEIQADLDILNEEQLNQILEEIQNLDVPENERKELNESIDKIEKSVNEIKEQIQKELNK